jgi:hypothetical protein
VPTPSLDDLRTAHPLLGFALYAYEPGGPVTLEIHAPDGGVYSTTGPTAEAAIAVAFPPRAAPPPPAASVFD